MNDESEGMIPVSEHDLHQATTARGFDSGVIVFGRFVLRRVLGRGGMGIVWLAFDNQLEQEVAIKVLPDLVAHDREAVIDMKRETKRSLQLNHHHIVRIFDFNQDERGVGISMEFVNGETLSMAKVERPQGCFDAEVLGPWVQQICEALAYAHTTAKIVHRDLKPANIMLSRDHTIKVTDFGIARSISDSVSRVSMRHAASGTMAYMSPQQSAGARSSQSDDIYALGATIYDLLTGKPPFFSGNIQHQLESIVPPTMAQRRAELERSGSPIPEAWEKAVASCLEKEPYKRPASVHELADRLGLALAAPKPSIALSAGSTIYSVPPLPVGLIDTASSETIPNLLTRQTETRVRRPLIAPGLLTPRKLRWAGYMVGASALLAAFALGAAWIVGQGTMKVATQPPGATVTIGATSVFTPATFPRLWSGKKKVSIVLAGYDPVQVEAPIKRNMVTDLGSLALVRSTGNAQIISVPSGALVTIKMLKSPAADEDPAKMPVFSGRTPWRFRGLATGSYELDLTAPDSTIKRAHFEIKSGHTLFFTLDLVRGEALHLLSGGERHIIDSSDPLPGALRQDEKARSDLTAYYRQTFLGYLVSNEFKLAEDQLHHLSGDFGVATGREQGRLDIAQNGWLEESKAKLIRLMEQNRFLSAAAVLEAMNQQTIATDLSGPRADFQKAKAVYDQEIAELLQTIEGLSSAGINDQAYRQAISASETYPESVGLQQELATLELPKTSTFDRVLNRLKAFNVLLSIDPTLANFDEFRHLLSIFQLNLDRHNSFRAQISAAQRQLGIFESKIADCRAEQEHNRRKANGYRVLTLLGIGGGLAGIGTNSGVGAAAGFTAGAIGANGAGARDADVRGIQGEIDSLEEQAQPSRDQLAAIRGAYATLQQTPIELVR